MEYDLNLVHTLIKILRENEEVSFLTQREFDKIQVPLFDISRQLGVACEVAFRTRKSGIKSELFDFELKVNEGKILKNLKFLRRLIDVDDFILLKGFSIAQKYYGDLRRRHTGDIDILVKDGSEFKKFFNQENFSKVRPSEIKKILGHAETFFKEGISVGLHTFICDRFFSDIRFEDVETEEIEIEFKNLQLKVKTLKKYWDLIQVSLHLFQHAFPIRILLDIRNIINKLEKEHLESARFLSKKFSVENELLISVISSKKLFGGEVDLRDLFYSTSLSKFFYCSIVSDFLSSDIYLLRVRPRIFAFPYLDKIFSLAIALKFPWRKISSILPVFPREFIRRLRKEYATTD